MNAKAKVVELRCPTCDAPAARHLSSDYNGSIITAWHYDHEAAMAEPLARKDVWKNCADKQAKRLQDLLEQHKVLLVGLEALAGELDLHEGVSPRKWQIKEWAQTIRTLTNSANSENHEVLKS